VRYKCYDDDDDDDFCVFTRPVYLSQSVILHLVYFLFVILFGYQYYCNWMLGKTHLRNDLLCVDWDVKPYTLTHPYESL